MLAKDLFRLNDCDKSKNVGQTGQTWPRLYELIIYNRRFRLTLVSTPLTSVDNHECRYLIPRFRIWNPRLQRELGVDQCQ